MDNSFCILCNGEKSGEVVMVQRGVDTIRQCSVIRKDGIAARIGDSATLTVHVDCRKEYTRRPTPPSNSKHEPAKRKSRSTFDSFDFKRQCMFCERDIIIDKAHPDRGEPYSVVAVIHIIDTVRSMASRRSDTWAEKVLLRFNTEIDLVAAEARYHRKCYAYFDIPGQFPPTLGLSSGNNVGRPEDPSKMIGFEKLCEYLESNDECQYSFTELLEFMRTSSPDEVPYSTKHLKRKLQSKYGSQIVIAEQIGRTSILCFADKASKILSTSWYSSRKHNPEEERMRIVQTAAEIIREDVRSRVYDCSVYPTSEDIASGREDLVPETLLAMIRTIVQKKSKPFDDDIVTKRKAINIAHAIIANARPRSFVSPLQLGLGVHLHRRFGSKLLLDVLSRCGVSATYKETINFETSMAENAPPVIDNDAYVQYVFDNADHNVNTLDGHRTFHAMGGIKCITPGKSVNVSAPVPRSSQLLEDCDLPSRGLLPVTPYQRPVKLGTSLVVVKDVSSVIPEPESAVNARLVDTLWLLNYHFNDEPGPGWSGFMDAATRNSTETSAEMSSVLPLPFVNLSPSNPSTIYTCLLYAANQSEAKKQTCVVTFDQPLYAKALDIVLSAEEDSPVSRIILRLGGFHLLMSYMGAVGTIIMAGSGLEDLWETVYAKNSVDKMMSGHAYARAIRAHLLSQVALASLLVGEIKEDTTLTEELKAAHQKLLLGEDTFENICNTSSLADASSRFSAKLEEVASSGPTATYWIEYFRMVTIMRLFIRAERAGDWNLHLYCVQSMIPYLHSAGHLNYAKYAHFYLQLMLEIEQVMTPPEFEKFVTQGFFTVRRSEKFWCGIWTDMTIEQVLMRTMKSAGGLTHGRGMSDNVIARWVTAMPATSDLVDAVERFSGVFSETCDQHVELRESRQIRDKRDLDKMAEWLHHHNPFEELPVLVSLNTRVVADDSVNCHKAYALGLQTMKSIAGQRFSDVHLKRTDKVRSFASVAKSTKIRDTTVEINPNQLFHRILCVLRNKEELSTHLRYELAARPPALFDGVLLRKGTKSSLITVLEQFSACEEALPSNPVFTVDGGFLLHRVVWMRPATYSQICRQYVKYIENYFGMKTTVVFDGYGHATTKDAEHARRTGKEAADAVIEDSTPTTVPQGVFLSNENNKKRFIALVSRHLTAAGIRVIQADDDADTLIVSTAADTARKTGVSSVIVGEDTDLLVLMASVPDVRGDICMFIPGKKDGNSRIFSCAKLKSGLGDLLPVLLFFHAATGCDTTSAPFRKGKSRPLKQLQESAELRNKVAVFNKPHASHEEIAAAGEAFLLSLYGCPMNSQLDSERYKFYMRTVAKQSLKSEFDLAILPPTSSAAEQHSFRVYHQVQAWKGNRLPATLWGWSVKNGRFTPVPCTSDPAPADILKIISCNCKSGCERKCSCSLSGLRCTEMCGYCAGHGCANRPEEDNDVDDPESV